MQGLQGSGVFSIDLTTAARLPFGGRKLNWIVLIGALLYSLS